MPLLPTLICCPLLLSFADWPNPHRRFTRWMDEACCPFSGEGKLAGPTLFLHHQNGVKGPQKYEEAAVLTCDWRLIYHSEKEYELYQIQDDPSQQTDLSAENPKCSNIYRKPMKSSGTRWIMKKPRNARALPPCNHKLKQGVAEADSSGKDWQPIQLGGRGCRPGTYRSKFEDGQRKQVLFQCSRDYPRPRIQTFSLLEDDLGYKRGGPGYRMGN